MIWAASGSSQRRIGKPLSGSDVHPSTPPPLLRRRQQADGWQQGLAVHVSHPTIGHHEIIGDTEQFLEGVS